MPGPFNEYQTFTQYLVAQGWVKDSDAEAVKSAVAAFENTQRHRGSDAAREAMEKAARKAW